MTSTRDLSAFPDIPALRRRLQALAMLDAVLSPAWEYRYFSFDSRWAAGEAVGSMRDGTGNHFFAWFGRGGCWLKGFDHESPMSPYARPSPQVFDGVLVGVPGDFVSCLREPAFIIEETSFCVWRRATDAAWKRGPVAFPKDDPDPDGSAGLLASLDGEPKTYADWARDYYARDVPIAAVEAIYAHRPLDAGLLKQFNGPAIEALRKDAAEIGYPVPPRQKH